MQNENYQQTPEKTKNNGQHKKKDNYHLSLLCSLINAINLRKYRLEIYILGRFWPKFLWYAQNFQQIYLLFPN